MLRGWLKTGGEVAGLRPSIQARRGGKERANAGRFMVGIFVVAAGASVAMVVCSEEDTHAVLSLHPCPAPESSEIQKRGKE